MPRHLITFWWARKSKLYTTWKPGLSWEASINHHDSVFVCHLCWMKQVRFSFNQYSCPLLLWNSTRFTRTCSRNCELKHIFTVVVHSNLVVEWIQWRHWQSINLLPSVDIKSKENTILTFRCLNTLIIFHFRQLIPPETCTLDVHALISSYKIYIFKLWHQLLSFKLVNVWKHFHWLPIIF